ncbi:MAG: hypothetical protein JWM80_4431 [Cyanobacteria bacterium RYN_339]|nr:hypothetical protein [Cyanobacteria bacterium RYN_339]
MSMPVGPGPFQYGAYQSNPRLSRATERSDWQKPLQPAKPKPWWLQRIHTMFQL